VSIVAFLIFWGLALYGFFHQDKKVLLALLFGMIPFGSFAVITPTLTAGLTFTATPIILLMLLGKSFFSNEGSRQFFSYALSKQKALWLFGFWVVAAFITLSMPRLFAGDVLVIPVRSDVLSHAVALYPTTQNLSQLVYLSISVFSVFMFANVLQTEASREHILKAICIGGLVTVLTGILDFTSQYVPLDFLLEPFRNATYTLLTDAEVISGKRVVGLMPEASSFGNISLAFLTVIYFTRIAIENTFYRDKLAPVVIFGLFLMIWLSTSSAAYVGVAVFGLLAVLEWCWRLNKSQQNSYFKRGLVFQAWFLNGLLIGLLLTVLFNPSLFEPVIEIVDSMVFQKTDSDSFAERSMWTAVSWQALLDTYGLGVGVGGTRASNGVVALTSNVGFIGAIFFYGFLLHLFLKKAKPNDATGEALISAVKWSFVPSFIIDLLITTTPDFGVVNAFRFGLILAIAFSLNSNQPVSSKVA